MKKALLCVALVLVWLGPARAGHVAPPDVLPDIELAGPVPEKAAAALGLAKGRAAFRLSEIKAKFVLIEIFSMYCPYCQAEAPALNRLHALLGKSPQGKDIRLIGIGAGNSAYEVDFFRQNYAVSFPLFADGDYRVHKIVGEVGTPAFILVRNAPEAGKLKVLLFQEGAFKTPEAFLGQVLRKAGLK
jgi:thiol-disulfide isomerase/thioredoxin